MNSFLILLQQRPTRIAAASTVNHTRTYSRLLFVQLEQKHQHQRPEIVISSRCSSSSNNNNKWFYFAALTTTRTTTLINDCHFNCKNNYNSIGSIVQLLRSFGSYDSNSTTSNDNQEKKHDDTAVVVSALDGTAVDDDDDDDNTEAAALMQGGEDIRNEKENNSNKNDIQTETIIAHNNNENENENHEQDENNNDDSKHLVAEEQNESIAKQEQRQQQQQQPEEHPGGKQLPRQQHQLQLLRPNSRIKELEIDQCRPRARNPPVFQKQFLDAFKKHSKARLSKSVVARDAFLNSTNKSRRSSSPLASMQRRHGKNDVATEKNLPPSCSVVRPKIGSTNTSSSETEVTSKVLSHQEGSYRSHFNKSNGKYSSSTNSIRSAEHRNQTWLLQKQRPQKRCVTLGDYLHYEQQTSSARSNATTTAIPTSNWVRIENISPLSSLEAMVSGINNALNTEAQQRGILDLDAAWDPTSSQPSSSLPFLAVGDGGEGKQYQWVKKAKLILSPFGRPNGWYVQFENRSIVHALLNYQNNKPEYSSGHGDYGNNSKVQYAWKKVRIYEHNGPVQSTEKHIVCDESISDHTVRIENCPVGLTDSILLHFLSRYDLSSAHEGVISLWEGQTSDGKNTTTPTYIVQFADASWARAAVRENQCTTLRMNPNQPLRFVQYPKQII